MKKYRARFGDVFAVEIERETGSFVVFSNGKREAKNSDWGCYFDTKDAAVDWLILKEKNAVDAAVAALQYRRGVLSKLCEKFNRPTPRAKRGEGGESL
jgi:hypothetical protein